MFVLYICVSVSILQIRLSIPFFKIIFLDINVYLLILFTSDAQSCLILCDPMDCSTPGHHPLPTLSLFKLVSIELVMLTNHLIICHPLLLPPSIFPSIRVFSKESALHIRWLKYGVSASTSILPMNIQGLFPLGWTGWISLQFKGLSRVSSNTTVQKHQFFGAQLSL